MAVAWFRSAVRSRAVPLALGAALGAAAIGGVAIVGATDEGEQIDACVTKFVGLVRIPEDGGDCRPSEEPLSWNAEGQPGAQGEQGPPGVGEIQVVQSESAREFGEYKFAQATCPEGTTLVSGGAATFFRPGTPLEWLPNLVSSFRFNAEDVTGTDTNTWYAEAVLPGEAESVLPEPDENGNDIEYQWYIYVEAYCASNGTGEAAE